MINTKLQEMHAKQQRLQKGEATDKRNRRAKEETENCGCLKK